MHSKRARRDELRRIGFCQDLNQRVELNRALTQAVFADDRNVRNGNQIRRPLRVDFAERLHSIPVHERQIGIGDIFAMSNQR